MGLIDGIGAKIQCADLPHPGGSGGLGSPFCALELLEKRCAPLLDLHEGRAAMPCDLLGSEAIEAVGNFGGPEDLDDPVEHGREGLVVQGRLGAARNPDQIFATSGHLQEAPHLVAKVGNPPGRARTVGQMTAATVEHVIDRRSFRERGGGEGELRRAQNHEPADTPVSTSDHPRSVATPTTIETVEL
jgi:hypothetical protein